MLAKIALPAFRFPRHALMTCGIPSRALAHTWACLSSGGCSATDGTRGPRTLCPHRRSAAREAAEHIGGMIGKAIAAAKARKASAAS